MVGTNIKIAWRNLSKNKAISIINIVGLSLGLISSILAIMFAKHELTFESCHKNADQLYRVFISGNFGEFQQVPATFGPEGRELKSMFPEIEDFSVSRSLSGTVRVGDNIFNEKNILYADSSLFSIFTIPFKKGQPSQNPLTVTISEKTANRYFGDDNPLGQSISINTYGEKVDFTITGVFEDFPTNTHTKTDFIIPSTFCKRIPFWNADEYNSTSFNTYLMLPEGVDYKALNKKIVSQFKIPVNLENVHAFIMPLKEIHFSGFFDNNRNKMIGFLFAGLFVLMASLFNYINLTNILYTTRKQEIGIRKVNGGIWNNIFGHFIMDTIVVTFICFAISIVVVLAILPWFNRVMATHISITLTWQTIFPIISLFTATVILAGTFPSLSFSFNKPISLLQNNDSRSSGHSRSRYILTTLQFIMAIIFIQMIFTINKQDDHLNSKDVLGYNSDNVLCISGYAWGDLNTVKEELMKLPDVENVSWGSNLPSMGLNVTMDWKEADNQTPASIYNFENDYLKTFEIQMKEGDFFNDKTMFEKSNGVVINKETAQILELENPIGHQVLVRGKTREIIGVVGDYMAHPPIFKPGPILIIPSGQQSDFLFIKINEFNRQGAMKNISTTLKSINSEYPIDLKFHKDYINSFDEVKSYISTFSLIKLFFLLTIITALIGLFGLSLFIANQNKKQIGIRKVCGATMLETLMVLMKKLIIQTAIAICISLPIIYMITKGFDANFPYKFNPSFLFYFSGSGLAMLLLFCTVLWQTLKVAKSNPVESLRYE